MTTIVSGRACARSSRRRMPRLLKASPQRFQARRHL